jgi:hypothetical protein
MAIPFGWRCHPAYAVPSQARLRRQAWDGPVPEEESGGAAIRTLLGLFLDLFFLFVFHLALAELLLVEILVEVEVGVLVRLGFSLGGGGFARCRDDPRRTATALLEERDLGSGVGSSRWSAPHFGQNGSVLLRS